MKTIAVRCKNNGEIIDVPIGSTLTEVHELSNLQLDYGPVCARVNNKVQGMHYTLHKESDVEFLTLKCPSGMRAYTRTLFFVLVKAVSDLYKDGTINIEAPLSKGYYCELHIGHTATQDDIDAIKHRMQEIIDENIPIQRIQAPIEDVTELFRSRGMESKAQLLECQNHLYAHYYRMDDTVNYFYSCLLKSTGDIHLFDLQIVDDVVLLLIPSMENPSVLNDVPSQAKMLGVIKEHHRWQNILGVRTAAQVNHAVQTGKVGEIINVSEALQERKIMEIADEIMERGSRLVLLAGPSSSGKTTTSKRLAIQLMACGLRPHTISTDDYFVNRVDTPLDEKGEYDFECIGAVDTDFFQKQMSQLLSGEEIELPRYDFKIGERVFEGNRLKIGADDVIILEGTHALNPIMSSHIAEKDKYRVYVSPMTAIALDDHNYVPTADIRLLRRILRDYHTRGYSAKDTIRRNPSVVRGEGKWINPFEECADAVFNSALLYELGVIRPKVLPLLEQVSERDVEYAEAYRLRNFLHYFASITADQVPPTSLLREFAGGSSFVY